MTHPTANRVLRTALFTLVPLAYLSIGLWSPANAYTKSGRAGVSPGLAVLMTAVLIASLLSWNRHRLVAALGLLGCFLWLATTLLPVL